MADDRLQRRLAAIAVIDVVGYSRLMGADEAGTVAVLRRQRETLLEPIVADHGGRIVKLMGDGALIEFASAVNAVEATLELQGRFTEANASLPEERRIVLRIGVNLGDVIGEGADIYGDGVNIAARLEGLAEPGGLCLSGKVYEEVRGKLELPVEDMGEVELKNIARPVRAWRWTKDGGGSASTVASAAGDKPSIAVLAFDNMSGDPGQDYFSDGISENIITALARFRDLVVIARNSSFAYKGKSPEIKQVSRELGVRYVLEGSVQRAGNRVRITAQLIDGATGRHVWADRYDRNVEDIFAVQDEVAHTIVGTLASAYGGRLHKAWQQRTRNSAAPKYEAFDYFLRGVQAFDRMTKEDMREARELCEEAFRIDPGYAKACAKIAWTHVMDVVSGWTESPERSRASALEFARRSLVLEDDEAWGHWVLAACHVNVGRHDLARAEFERALALNPNDADVLADFGWSLSYAGEADEGLELMRKAMRQNPHYPEWYLTELGMIQFNARQYAEAAVSFERARGVDNVPTRLYHVASLAALGQTDKAKNAVDAVLVIDPAATVAKYTDPAMAPYQQARDAEHFRHWLREAGLPQ